MMLVHYTSDGDRRITDTAETLKGESAVVVGGAPSLHKQDLTLLERRGLLTVAMNNAAKHFRPALWVSVDNPRCFDTRILFDPTVVKYGNIAHADITVRQGTTVKYSECPNMYFFIPEQVQGMSLFLEPTSKLPWYNNTMYTSIQLLYFMGIRRIILCGCPLRIKAGEVYAHKSDLSAEQIKWNKTLYDRQAYDLKSLKPLFDSYGLTLMDASIDSRLKDTYETITLADAVDLCTEKIKSDDDFTHCSVFADDELRARVKQWPGYKVKQLKLEKSKNN